MLPAGELARMRADLVGVLPDTCNILTCSYTGDGTGSFRPTWGTATSNVACRLDAVPRTNSEINTGAEVKAFQKYILTLPQSASLTTEQRVEIAGVAYNVVTAIGGSWQACGRFYVEKVT